MDKINKNFFESYDSFEISLGELLRGERATLGKSCSDVQKDLKIKAIYIKAIESWQKCKILDGLLKLSPIGLNIELVIPCFLERS